MPEDQVIGGQTTGPGKRIDEKTGTVTVGHEWDGIEELDTPMPRWWLWTLYATIVFAIGYMIAYPAWPLVDSATKGVLGWTSHGELEQALAADRTAKEAVRQQLAATPVERLEPNSPLMRAAVEGGRSAFKVHCVQCHGSGAAGFAGYPNLNDDDWLWGGNIREILTTITNGIRQPGNDDTHLSMMPAFGRDGILTTDQVRDVVAHVRVISGQDQATEASARGAALFGENCTACHGADGKGDRNQGAPNLTDAIWLYGGDVPTLIQTVTNARAGVMPAWNTRLDEVTLKMLAAYVHSLGGGEALPFDPVPVPTQ
ncbi:cytochrome-c oxidase, cbb3-type subunit III [Zavarzinia sp. CC-PAN008]|uniref:cytochrome-c oxidase, cbb3-type subunit III n=1 Tax=Zavarzinia sp. CC-PAN008 TaxID=3243332 RepID=UPI003F747309